jgi:hypothetical protein
MPLYLVRWPLMKASLIRAESEEHLLDILDEVASPTACTWKKYNGPLWIDFEIPGVEQHPKRPGPLELDEVSIENPEEAVEEPVTSLPESETVAEMIDGIRKIAFPQLQKALERFFAEDDDFGNGPLRLEQIEAVRAAVARDEVQHDQRRRRRSVTFDDEGYLKATRELCLQRHADGFRTVGSVDVERFCFGRKRLQPDDDGFVKLAFVSIHPERDNRWTAHLGSTIRLRTDAEGMITSAHRADAFDKDGAAALAGFRDRRNAAVQWQMSAADIDVLKAALEKHAPGAELVREMHEGS